MKQTEWIKIHAYCMEKPGAYESHPFGEYPICYRLCGKIFAQLSPEEEWFKITLKTNPEAADFYRQAFPGVVVRGYHCPPVQQPYWNTIDLERFEMENLWGMIDEAYEEIVKNLPKKLRQRLPFLAELRFVKAKDGSNEITVYQDKEVIAGGRYCLYDEETVEIGQMYVEEQQRGRGIARELLLRLEADARMAGFRLAILKTQREQETARALYKKAGYKVIPNYGQYLDMPDAVCMMKKL